VLVPGLATSSAETSTEDTQEKNDCCGDGDGTGNAAPAMMTFCTICKALISEKRAARGSHFCGERCHEDYRRARRAWRASRYCRLCGRPARPVRLQAKEEAVPMEHSGADRLMEGEL
jgi:hypothetical protein